MEPLLLGRKQLSPIIWELILQSTCTVAEYRRKGFFQEVDSLEALRESADYNTGSITAATCWSLLSVAHYFKPKIIVEVGTFIGKSTLSLSVGMEFGGVQDGKIYTCDLSNDIELPFARNREISQFRRQSSTQMLTALSASNTRCDLLFLDGRLQKEDLQYLGTILHSNSIILLDDFEGVEKGALNASLLMNSLQQTHSLVYPPNTELLRRFSLLDSCTTALIIPRSAMLLSNQ
jgi:predicted O-methyltransferase YrrM